MREERCQGRRIPSGMEIMSERTIREKGWFEGFKKGIHQVNRFIAGVGACFLIPLMIITAGDVVGRDVFNHPIPETVELSQYMLTVFILLGLAYPQQVKAHVGVSVMTSRLRHPAQLILTIITTLI